MKHTYTTTRRGLLALTAAAALGLMGCETTPTRPAEMARPDRAAIGVQLKGVGVLGALSTQTPDEAIFVRLEGDSLVGDELVRSNFGTDGRIYLLNASPGTYAIVAAVTKQPSPLAYGPPIQAVTFFCRELIEATRVELRAGELSFLGRLEVTLSMAHAGGDDLQLHYRRIIQPSAPPSGYFKGILQMLGGDSAAWGTPRSSDKSPEAKAAFVQAAREDLAGRGWDASLAALR